MQRVIVAACGALLIWCLAGGVQAAERRCEVASNNERGRTVAYVTVDEQSGRLSDPRVYWGPPADPQYAILNLVYVADVDGRIGELSDVIVAALLPVEMMRAPHAAILLRPDQGIAVTRPWLMYSQARAEAQRPTSTEYRSRVFTGFVPFGPANEIAGLAEASTVEVGVVGSDGHGLTQTIFDLSARAAAHADMQSSLTQALAAARTNASSCPLAEQRQP